MLRLERTSFSPLGRPIKITCVGVADIGLTRGSDNDFLVALINIYIDNGCPEDGVVVTSAYALLKAAGRRTGGQYYLSLSQSLERMLNTTFNITDGWFDVGKGRYKTASFRIIDNLTRTHGEPEEGQIILDRKSALRIRLNEEITRSIKSGYIKQLDMEVYHGLRSVGSRALYRHLDVYLHEAEQRGEQKTLQISFELTRLAGNCGLIGKRTDHLRSTIEAMCQPLVEIGYLQRVDYTGRGAKTKVHFTYNNSRRALKEAFPLATLNDVELLVSKEVNVRVAWWASHTLGRSAIDVAIERVDDQIRKGIKLQSKGAYLTSILRDDPSVSAEAAERKLQSNKQYALDSNSSSREDLRVKAENDAQQDFEDKFNNISEPEDLMESLERILNSITSKSLTARGLTVEEFDRIRSSVIDGRLIPKDLSKAIGRVLAVPEGLEELRQLIK